MQAFLGIGLTSEQIVWTDGAMFPGLKTRVFSTWQNPNLLGGYFDLMLGLMAGMFLLIKHKIVRIVIAILFCLTAFCLTLTYARAVSYTHLASPTRVPNEIMVKITDMLGKLVAR